MVNFYPEEESKDISKFNPAAYKMSRIHYFTGVADEARAKPKEWNYEQGNLNCLVWFNNWIVIYKEVSVKFSDDEKGECEIKKRVIEGLMKKYPLYFKIGKKIEINYEIINIFIKYIDEYEMIVRHYQDKHGLDTPNIEDDMGL